MLQIINTESAKQKVNRGDVYLCNFGNPYGGEQGYIRPAVVLQNDSGNTFSPTTIVVPCTTRKKKKLPVHCEIFIFGRLNTVLAEQVRTVDKTRLLKYLGNVSPYAMEEINEIIKISLGLN